MNIKKIGKKTISKILLFSLLFNLIIINQTFAIPDPSPSIPFTEHDVVTHFAGANNVFAVDMDNDGDMDILGSAYYADDITWWENNGTENFPEHTIDGDFDGAMSVFAVDMDNDGDMDVLGAAYLGDDITWWENDGTENFPEHVIDGDFDGAASVYAADMDNDGDMDVLGASFFDVSITWWENDGAENFTEEHTIDGDFGQPGFVYAADMDNDGDMDVLGAASNIGDVAWWENNGSESFTKYIIDGDFVGVESVYTTDIDNDGDIDVLGASDAADDIVWWENNGSESFTKYIIDGDFDGAASVYVADMDNDGDVDVLGAASNIDDVVWWENDGSGNFSDLDMIDGDFDGVASVYAADMDNDGDVDVLGAGKTLGDITWWENTTEVTSGYIPFDKTTIVNDFNGSYSMYVADMDNDGDMDVLGAAYVGGNITWWENDGSKNFTEEHTIDSDFGSARSVYATDMDNDGDMDVLGASSSGIKDITWWENSKDGEGNIIFTVHVIDAVFSSAYDVYATDMDNDGDMDVLGVSYLDDVVWWENDGSENFTKSSIVDNFDGATSVYATDMDNDGDMDVLGAASTADDITWWENNGSEVFTEHIIDGDFDSANDVYATDMDNDGDMDVLGAAYFADDITWWENDGAENFSEHLIDGDFNGANSVYAIDMDRDGDMDVLGSSSTADDITWWENSKDGEGNIIFTEEHTIDGDFDGHSVCATDIDNDGDIDILGVDYHANTIALWEHTIDNTSPIISEVTAVTTPSNDVTPDYIFTIDEAGTISYGGSCSSTVTSASSGNNTITFNALTEGTYSDCTIVVADLSSNESNTITIPSFTIETTNPTVILLPLDDAIDIIIDSNFEITFNEDVVTSTGNIVLYKTSDDNLIETIDVTSVLVTASGTTAFIINPTSDLDYETEYYILIDTTSFDDVAGNSYTGISASTTWTFTTLDTPICPSISNASTYNSYPTCGVATCDSGYNLSDGTCVAQGGGSFTPPTPPVVIQAPQIKIINGKVSFEVDNVEMIAISETEDFKGVSWEPYVDSFKNSNKKLYIKFRSKEGGTSKVFVVEPEKTSVKNVVKEKVPIVKAETEKVILKKVKKVLFTKNLEFGMKGEEVKQLQVYLNNHGFLVDTQGLGSSGQETIYFGNLTKQALIKFQKSVNLPAYGYFGPMTRGLIN